jgi:hypothetical protein
MGRLAWSQVRFRLARTLALVAGVLVAAKSLSRSLAAHGHARSSRHIDIGDQLDRLPPSPRPPAVCRLVPEKLVKVSAIGHLAELGDRPQPLKPLTDLPKGGVDGVLLRLGAEHLRSDG